jgi:hypothetical protein
LFQGKFPAVVAFQRLLKVQAAGYATGSFLGSNFEKALEFNFGVNTQAGCRAGIPREHQTAGR